MSILLAVVSSLSLYAVLSQRSWLGVLIGLQLLLGAIIVAMLALPGAPTPGA